MVAVIFFLLVVRPYLSDTKERFGRYLYNVNSTFFVWCDSWAEARAFAEQYHIERVYPDAPPEAIPSAANYWRTHSIDQMVARMRFGLSVLAELAYRSSYLKYLVLLALVAAFVAWNRQHLLRTMRAEDWLVLAFCALVGTGYLVTYAWYALVAYGDRFILSLVLPIAFGLSWFVARFGKRTGQVLFGDRRVRLAGLTFALCSGALVLEGVGEVLFGVTTPNESFIQFCFNESLEAQRAGDRHAAVRGYQGVLQLDPTFAPAHHELGLLAMQDGYLDEALRHLTEAVRHRENDPNLLNSLGSVLIQLDRLPEAIRALTLATSIDPGFVSAWFNLGGALHLLGDDEAARSIVERLERLDAATGRRLRAVIES
jgi:tetratricopeptide (TPR) repeat protein